MPKRWGARAWPRPRALQWPGPTPPAPVPAGLRRAPQQQSTWAAWGGCGGPAPPAQHALHCARCAPPHAPGATSVDARGCRRRAGPGCAAPAATRPCSSSAAGSGPWGHAGARAGGGAACGAWAAVRMGSHRRVHRAPMHPPPCHAHAPAHAPAWRARWPRPATCSCTRAAAPSTARARSASARQVARARARGAYPHAARGQPRTVRPPAPHRPRTLGTSSSLPTAVLAPMRSSPGGGAARQGGSRWRVGLCHTRTGPRPEHLRGQLPPVPRT